MIKQLAFLGLVVFPIVLATTDRVVCYYRSWSSYSGIQPENFNPNLCSHLNYAFVTVNSDGSLSSSDVSLDINQGLYLRVTGLKSINPALKVLLSIGGGSSDATDSFIQVAADPSRRANFVNSCRSYMQTYHFDGVDIDWEYPREQDRDNFISLLNDLKNSFRNNGWLVTAAVSANPSGGYNVPQMSQILDFINIMTYDMYGPWSSYTGQNSPLYASPVENQWEKENLNVAAASSSWLNAGANVYKLSVGTAFYGRSFTLADPNQHGIHAPITGSGVGSEGTLNYNDICKSYNSWTRVWDNDQKNPYKYSGNQWFGYDDVDSITLKAQYIKSHNFGGVMIWAIDGDDVHGTCGDTQILLKTINNNIN